MSNRGYCQITEEVRENGKRSKQRSPDLSFAYSLQRLDRLVELLRRMHLPVFVVARGEIFAEMAAAAFFAPQGGFGHQSGERDEVSGSLVDLFFCQMCQFRDGGLQLIGSADQADFPPHQFLHASFGALIQSPVG